MACWGTTVNDENIKSLIPYLTAMLRCSHSIKKLSNKEKKKKKKKRLFILYSIFSIWLALHCFTSVRRISFSSSLYSSTTMGI